MKQFHVAATQINCLYRKRKAIAIVSHKKLQNSIEKALFDAQRQNDALLVIQKTIRMCSARVWIHSFGKDFNRELARRSASVKAVLRKKKGTNKYASKLKPVLNSDAKRERIRTDVEKRVHWNRANLLYSMEMLYSATKQVRVCIVCVVVCSVV